jgi:L-rhamnose isomerase/sugar isomerase
VSAKESERAEVAFMIDQSHNLKGKMEAMVQTVVTAQELYAKSSLIDQDKLAGLQDACRLVEAEECFRSAFWQDVRPIVREWRAARGLPADPLQELADSGYVEKITRERESKNSKSVSSYA